MAHRATGQLSLADGLLAKGAGVNRQLEAIVALLDWSRFEALLGDIHASPIGRPSYPPLCLFRCLLLQQWYRLSDPGLEEALGDRLSFRRFVGLGLDATVPDHSTLSRFRKALAERDRLDALLAELNRQLDGRGMILRTGTLIDASLVAADARIKRRGLGSAADSDGDARWAARRSGAVFGYKAHVAVDAGSGLIRAAVLTSAEVGDSTVCDQLIQGDEAAVYADRAYDSDRRRERLHAQGIADGIMRRRRRGQPADPALAARNAALAICRAPVERVFATMKRWYGYSRVRYRSLARNAVQLGLLCMAINMRRAIALQA